MPVVVILPILFPIFSVNHTLPSGPAVTPLTRAPMENCLITPAVVILPILLVRYSVNHRLPSGPAVISPSVLPLGTGNWLPETAPSVNHRLPSGPVVIG